MKYSFVIPHINEGFFLDITLDSILNKVEYEDFEIVIIDDGSKNLRDLKFIKRHPLYEKIKLYYENNFGAANARNYGAKKADGEFLIFLDSHMYFVDDFLSKLDYYLKTYEELTFMQPVIGSFQNKSAKGLIYKIGDYTLKSKWDIPRLNGENNDYLNSDCIETPCIAGGAFIVKKEIFDVLGGFNENFVQWGAEDLELSFRAWLRGYSLYLLPQLFVAHFFKPKFENINLNSSNVLLNKIIFTYACFSNKERQNKVVAELKNCYGHGLYEKAERRFFENQKCLNWLEKEKQKFIYDDDWYFDKFKDYYQNFILEKVENVQ